MLDTYYKYYSNQFPFHRALSRNVLPKIHAVLTFCQITTTRIWNCHFSYIPSLGLLNHLVNYANLPFLHFTVRVCLKTISAKSESKVQTPLPVVSKYQHCSKPPPPIVSQCQHLISPPPTPRSTTKQKLKLDALSGWGQSGVPVPLRPLGAVDGSSIEGQIPKKMYW